MSIPMVDVIKKDGKWFEIEHRTDHIINIPTQGNMDGKVTQMTHCDASTERAVPMCLLVKTLILILTLVTVYMFWLYFNDFYLAQNIRFS